MTREEAIFELMELAQSVINHANKDDEHPPELFTIAEAIKEEQLALDSTLSGSAYSEDYLKANEWLINR